MTPDNQHPEPADEAAAFKAWWQSTDAPAWASEHSPVDYARAAFVAGRAQGREEQRRADLAVLTSLRRIQVEGQWMIDLDVAEQRITEASSEEKGHA